jgi:hypothetical protein
MLNSEVRKALGYLRKRYRVSERDLVSLAKRLQSQEEQEEGWEEITKKYLLQRARRSRKVNG